MKILALNGSYRGERGHTRTMTDLLLRGAEEAGAQTQVIDLARLTIHTCLACGHCQQPDTRLQCVWGNSKKDDAAFVFDQMAQADILVFATPIYVFNISALLKILFERFYGICPIDSTILTDSNLLFHAVDRRVCSKPFVPLICCDNLEHETPRSAIEYFKTYARFMDARMAGLLVRNAAFLTGSAEATDAPCVRSAVPAVLDSVHAAYRRAGMELATGGRITASTQRRANREIMPVPMFGLLKHLPGRGIKCVFLRHAEEFRKSRVA